MSEQKFNIRKVGANFVAYDTVDKKRSYGKINIKTGKFTGDTRCMIALNNHWETKVGNKQEELYDKVLEQIKQDVAVGDMTAVDELIRFIPRKNLEAYLPETL